MLQYLWPNLGLSKFRPSIFFNLWKSPLHSKYKFKTCLKKIIRFKICLEDNRPKAQIDAHLSWCKLRTSCVEHENHKRDESLLDWTKLLYRTYNIALIKPFVWVVRLAKTSTIYSIITKRHIKRVFICQFRR